MILILLPVVLYISIFLHGNLVSVDVMEARNFISAREIVESGSWLLPTMNGEIRIAKPPLPTWITAIFMQWARTDADLIINRIPAGISALMLAVFVFLLVKRITSDQLVAVLSLLVLVTSYLFIIHARRNTWDIFSVTFMTGAVWALSEAFMRSKRKAIFFPLASVFMACAFYSKGPVPFWVILAPFLVSYTIAFGLKDMRDIRRGILWALFVCALISAAWPLYVHLNAPHAAAQVALKESSAWFTRHTRPFWYYLLYFPAISGVWLFFLLYGLAAPLIRKEWKPQEKFFAFWFILTIIFISVFPEKKLRYLLPAVVPAAVVSSLSALHLQRHPGVARKFVYGTFSIVTGLAFIAFAGALYYFSRGSFLILSGVPMLALAGVVVIYLYAKSHDDKMSLVVVAGICLCLVFLPPVIRGYSGYDGVHAFMRLRDVTEYRAKDFYSLGSIPAVDIWASGRTIRPLTEQQLASLIETGRPFILVSKKAVKQQQRKIRLHETIQTNKASYSMYLVNCDT